MVAWWHILIAAWVSTLIIDYPHPKIVQGILSILIGFSGLFMLFEREKK